MLNEILLTQRKFFLTDATKSIHFRKEMLKKLRNAISAYEQEFYMALRADLNKAKAEAFLTELQIVLSEINLALRKLSSWQSPKKAKTPLSLFPAKSKIFHEPFGSVLILSPWNYPFQLALAPIVGAIAGGNCIVLKASKNSGSVSRVIKKMLSKTFSPEYICPLSDEYSYDDILAQKYDMIFFTGSERVGKIVMKAASENLTPVVLELGGKSPCIVEKTADIPLAAKRIVWGKLLNSGQTCVAPDYVLVDKTKKQELITELTNQISKLYGDPLKNPDYPKIINQHHFDRLISYIDSEPDKLFGGSLPASLKIAPAIFINASFDHPVMAEEIFGPILPIIEYEGLDEVISKINDRPKPLALYLFTNDKKVKQKLIYELSFGGGCINDTVMHIANHYLPFGGVGSSGMGSYHGAFSFKTFTREKGVLMGKPYWDIPLRYPPYTKRRLSLIKRLMK